MEPPGQEAPAHRARAQSRPGPTQGAKALAQQQYPAPNENTPLQALHEQQHRPEYSPTWLPLAVSDFREAT